MKMHDLNQDQETVVLLLHPMLANAQLMEKLLAEPMGKEFRYLIPDFSGHGDAAAELYHSAKQEAQEIALYLKEHGISSVRLAFGASMGGAVLMELSSQSGVSIEKLFFEGSSFHEKADKMEVLIRAVMIKKHRKAGKDVNRTITKMGRLFGDNVKEIMGRQLINIQEESLRNVVHDCGHVHLPQLTEAQQRSCVFAYGEKDRNLKLAGKRLPQVYPHAALKIWPSYGHCGRMTADPQAYAKMLKEYLSSNG